MTEMICEECGLPLHVCSHIALVAIRYLRARRIRDDNEFERIRTILETRTANRITNRGPND